MTARLHDKIKNETIKKKKMAKIENFEDLEIWKSARILTKKVYLDFNDNKDYGFKDQIQRCSVSVMNNIAEGFCRNGDKEFHQYLKVAKASCGELKSMYYLAEDIVYINIDTALERRLEANNLMNGIGKFMQYLRNSYKK
jgi:four helix bundle protein